MAVVWLSAAQPGMAQDMPSKKPTVDASAKKKKAPKEELPPLVPEEESVDLGLSVRWAPFNVGATRPEEYGSYFAWGETKPKALYKQDTYRWYLKGTGMMDIGKEISGKKNDAASVIWRGTWRLPTRAECKELIEKCKWTHTKQNGVIGMLVTGPNGNSIFLPSGGYRKDDYADIRAEQVRGEYWTANLVQFENGMFSKDNALKMDFVDNKGGLHESYRFQGCMIRPVSEYKGETVSKSMAEAARGELGIFDLRGPVKQCTLVNEWGNTVRTFDTNGFWLTNDGKRLSQVYPSGIKRNAEGRIVKGTMDSDGNGEEYTYDAQGRVVKYHYHFFDELNTETTTYDMQGNVQKRHFEPGGMDAGEPYTETYKNLEVDQHGNWTKRQVDSTDGTTTTQTREIIYY